MKAELTRIVRFCLNADGSLTDDAPVANAFAAWPDMRGLGRYYQLHVTCLGEVDPATGYLVNITRIDRAVRKSLLPLVAQAAQLDGPVGKLLADLMRELTRSLDVHVRHVRLQLMPAHGIEMENHDMNAVLIDQMFDFSAAHRLHSPALNDAENRETFGKCNNPSGHGHNYRLRVSVRSPLDERGGIMSVGSLDELVSRVIIERFDHKHLNLDTAEFTHVNPTVENIAKVIYDLLAGEVKNIGVTLAHVTVWETDKTSATYPATE
ncbi:MAG: 6-carboxytetrahydropterin synthase [Phycisphaerales bacterium]